MDPAVISSWPMLEIRFAPYDVETQTQLSILASEAFEDYLKEMLMCMASVL